MSPSEYDPDVDPLDLWAAEAQQQQQHRNGSHSDVSSRRTSPMASPHLRGHVDLPTSSSTSSAAAAANNRFLTAGRFRPGAIARHSLLGAVEFRDVVRSLQQEALADRSMEVFQSRDPERFLHHRHHHSGSQLALHPSPPANVVGGARRGHGRIKSLVDARPSSAVEAGGGGGGSNLMRDRSISMGPHAAEGKPELRRAASTTMGGGTGVMAAATRMRVQENAQPSAFDARAVAAAVGDPWREHEQGDGCAEDADVLPPPAMPLDEEEEEAANRKPDLPRLVVGEDVQRQAKARPRGARKSTSKSLLSVSKRAGSSKGVDGDISSSSNNNSIPSTTDFRHLLKVLFPSLRHFKEKSWLGIAVGVVTAPAILILNLTLPVVDDDAERAAIEGHSLGGSPDGRIRLEGQEHDLYARQPYLGVGTEDDEEDASIIDLDGRSAQQQQQRSSMGSAGTGNPWKNAASEADDDDEQVDHLRVADALQSLPRESPNLLDGLSPSSQRPQQQQQQRHGASLRAEEAFSVVIRDDDDDDDDDRNEATPSEAASTESWASDDSHLDNSQSSHLFVVLAQCALAPPFCVWSITTSARSSGVAWKVAVAFIIGLCCALVAFVAVRRARAAGTVLSPQAVATVGWARVAMGFLVSILYIMTIVDEVVSILQTLGVILGLSDAILGLTVFAMGNSLGDLVANVTIARMGHPIMAISACFAGPLLNLLLGIGLSGSYLLSGRSAQGGTGSSSSSPWLTLPFAHPTPGVDGGIYHIDFSPTLFVSGIGLLVILTGTLIAVPLNDFYLNRTLGATLIATYVVIMLVNVGVELWSLRHQV